MRRKTFGICFDGRTGQLRWPHPRLFSKAVQLFQVLPREGFLEERDFRPGQIWQKYDHNLKGPNPSGPRPGTASTGFPFVFVRLLTNLRLVALGASGLRFAVHFSTPGAGPHLMRRDWLRREWLGCLYRFCFSGIPAPLAAFANFLDAIGLAWASKYLRSRLGFQSCVEGFR
jgi:hypothetical protein